MRGVYTRAVTPPHLDTYTLLNDTLCIKYGILQRVGVQHGALQKKDGSL